MGRTSQDLLASLRALIRTVAGSVRANISLALLAVVLAFVLWIFVTDTEGGATRSGTLPDVELTVEPVNLPRGLTVAGEVPKVGVRVEVDEDVWEELRAEDFDASIVLTGLPEGRHTVPVEVEAKTSRGDLKVQGAVPSEVEVTLVPLFVRSVSVVVEVQGTPPSGFRAGEPAADPGTVAVSGTEALVSLVSKAVAMVDVTGATEDLSGAFPLEARDEQGALVRGLIIDPPKVNVNISIEQKEFSRVLAISPDIVGSPAEGYNVVGVSVDPPVVTVVGPEDLLDALSSMRTAPVDVGGAKADVVRSVSVELPPGASVSGSRQVTVRVGIQAAIGQATFGVTPQVVGLAANLQVAGALPSAQVTLSGPLPVLRGVTPQSIGARVDLSGLTEGTHTVTVEAQPPSQTQLVSVTPAEMQITLQAKQ